MRRIVIVAAVAVVATGAWWLAEDGNLRRHLSQFGSEMLARASGGPPPSWGDVADKVGEFAERGARPEARGRRRKVAPDLPTPEYAPSDGDRPQAAGLDGIRAGLADAPPEREPRRGNAMPLDVSAAFALPDDSEVATLVGRVWRPDTGRPVGGRRSAARNWSTSAPPRPTVRDLCEAPEPAALARDAKGEPVGTLADILANTPRGQARPGEAVAARADRPAGGEGGGRHLRRLDARAGDRGAGARRARSRPPRSAREITATIGGDLAPPEAGLGRGDGLKALLIEKGMWSQYLEVGIGPDAEVFTKAPVLAAVGHLRRRRHAPDLELEQPRARGGARRRIRRARSSARPSATTSTCATSRAARRSLLGKAKDNNASAPRSGRSSACSTRASTSTTCGSARSRSPSTATTATGSTARARMAQDQPRPRRARRRDDRREPPVPRRLRALSRHDVRAGRGPRRHGPGLHPQGRRHRHHRLAGLGALVEPGRLDRADAEPWTFGAAALMRNLAKRGLI